jgi:magnesium transporter
MISVYKSAENGLEKQNDFIQNSWVQVSDPTSEEITQIQDLGVPLDFITYPLDLDERPRVEREDDGTLLVIIRIPVYQGAVSDIPYSTIPLGFVLIQNHLVTICREESDIFKDFTNGRIRNLSTGKRHRFILRFLLNASSQFLNFLREINKTTELIEDQLQKSMKNKEVLELLKYQKSLVFFTTALKANELVMERLQKMQFFKQYPDDEDLLEDVITENQQAIEMTNISGNILSSMMDAFASIISNNLNVVMKFLTSVTIVLSIPTIIGSLFGMNVLNPLEQNPYAFSLILGISLAISVLVVIVFVKRDWF